MRRRTAIQPTKTPAMTGGGDRPTTPCADHMAVYDTLIEGSGPHYRAAIVEARAICATCPVWQACLTANRREDWAQAVATGMTVQQRVKAGTYKPRKRYVTSAAQRAADLTAFADAGHDASTAAARLGISRDSLGAWCRKNGHRELWARLTREDVAA